MKRPLCTICCVLILCITVFMWLFPPRIPVFEEYDGEEMLITGSVEKKELHTVNNKETLVIYLKSVQAADVYSQTFPVPGTISNGKEVQKIKGIICYLNRDSKNCRIGANVTVKGRFQAFLRPGNPGEFDAALYYAGLGYQGRMVQAEILSEGRGYNRLRESLYQIRWRLGKYIDGIYEQKDAGLLKAVLLGEKAEVDSEWKELYQKSGIVHILAISGLHISVLGMGMYGLLRKLTVPVTVSAVCSFLFLVFYGIMVGNGISVLRAVGMFGIKSLGRIWGRTYDLITSLTLLGCLLLLEQPLYVYYSGFWLSFGSVAGIAILFPILQELIKIDKKYKKMTHAFLAGLSVTVMTAPIMLWFYYEIPVYSVFLNLLVLPIMTIVMVLGVGNLAYLSMIYTLLGCGAFEGGITEWAVEKYSLLFLPAKYISKVHHLIFNLFEWLCNMTERLPGNLFLRGRPALFQIVLFYIGLTAALLLCCRKKSYEKCRRKVQCAVGGMIFFCAVCVLLYQENSGFSVTALDVGQGNAGVILYQDTAVIIDAGSSSRKNVGKDILLPFLKFHGIRVVEAAFVTHPDEDHYNGVLELMESAKREGIRIKMLVLPDIANPVVRDGPAMQKLVQTAETQNIPVVSMEKGMQFQKKDMTITCMHPDDRDYGEDTNSYSQVLLIKYHLFCMAFMGDVQGEAEASALQEMQTMQTGTVTFLQAGHHGSKNASGQELLSYLQPEYTIISCGKNNRYGHPHKTVLERLEEVDSKIWITYLTGAVTIRTNGKTMKIERFRESFP